jgi:hypothetical protein
MSSRTPSQKRLSASLCPKPRLRRDGTGNCLFSLKPVEAIGVQSRQIEFKKLPATLVS